MYSKKFTINSKIYKAPIIFYLTKEMKLHEIQMLKVKNFPRYYFNPNKQQTIDRFTFKFLQFLLQIKKKWWFFFFYYLFIFFVYI